MLDLTKVANQMQGMSQHLNSEAISARRRLELSQELLQKAQQYQTEFVAQKQQWQQQILFNAATPVEPLDYYPYVAIPPKINTVLATDGSQISPSHHEIAYCYLINIGRILLHYGQGRQPLLDNVPEIFYKHEDLYLSRQWGIKPEDWMSYRRTSTEVVALADLGYEWWQSNGEKLPAPALAMVDGSLVYWFLEVLPNEAKNRILQPILDGWSKLRTIGIPVMGYVSASRSMESISFLRIPACPYQEPNCASYCPHVGLNSEQVLLEKAPCQVLEPLRDIAFWGSILEPGQRSPLWKSHTHILNLYGEHEIYFCYVHVGTEIARIEVPSWVAENMTDFELALSLMLGQVDKGGGYPISLAEAHNQAVVTGSDRSRFFGFLEQEMIKAGLQNVGISYKETRKRGSIA